MSTSSIEGVVFDISKAPMSEAEIRDKRRILDKENLRIEIGSVLVVTGAFLFVSLLVAWMSVDLTDPNLNVPTVSFLLGAFIAATFGGGIAFAYMERVTPRRLEVREAIAKLRRLHEEENMFVVTMFHHLGAEATRYADHVIAGQRSFTQGEFDLALTLSTDFSSPHSGPVAERCSALGALWMQLADLIHDIGNDHEVYRGTDAGNDLEILGLAMKNAPPNLLPLMGGIHMPLALEVCKKHGIVLETDDLVGQLKACIEACAAVMKLYEGGTAAQKPT